MQFSRQKGGTIVVEEVEQYMATDQGRFGFCATWRIGVDFHLDGDELIGKRTKQETMVPSFSLAATV